jgi:hypothetical protein
LAGRLFLLPTLIFRPFSFLRQLYLSGYKRETFAVQSIPFSSVFLALSSFLTDVLLLSERKLFMPLYVAFPQDLTSNSAHGADVPADRLLLYCCARYMTLSNKCHAKHGMVVF